MNVNVEALALCVTCLSAVVGAAWYLADKIGLLRTDMVKELRNTDQRHSDLSERVARVEEKVN